VFALLLNESKSEGRAAALEGLEFKWPITEGLLMVTLLLISLLFSGGIAGSYTLAGCAIGAWVVGLILCSPLLGTWMNGLAALLSTGGERALTG